MASLKNNPRRLLQLLWAAAGLLFAFAVVHSLSPSAPPGWVSHGVTRILGDGLRVPMAEHMRLAEASWAETVRQRHELIHSDYGTVDKMPL